MASPTLQAAILEDLLPTITKIRYAERECSGSPWLAYAL